MLINRWNAVKPLRYWPILLVALALAASGCGSDDGDSGSSDTAAAGSTAASGVTPEAQKVIDAYFEGSFAEPPSQSPPVKEDMNIWFIPYGADLQNWNEPGQIVEGADALGWNLTIFDGKFSPDTVVTGMRQAIADKADGVILIVVDCAPVKAGLQQLDRAGIPVVADESIDCDEAKPGDPRLFDASVGYYDPENPDKPLRFTEFIKERWGYGQGVGIVYGTKGEAKLVNIRETDLISTILADDGAQEALRDLCPDCEIAETVEMVGTDLGNPLQEKTAQALARNPDANAVLSPYDAATVNIAAAVMGSGRSDQIWSQGGEGLPPAVNLLENDLGVDAGVGLSIAWELWSALDSMNRLLNGEEPPKGAIGFPSGNGTELFTQDVNAPKGSSWQPPIDYVAAYKRAWGVE